MKYAQAKTFASSRFQDMTSQICLHSKDYDSLSLSNLTEPDSVSRCKQEELTGGLSKQSFKGSRAKKTKNALWFAADARTEHGRGPSRGGFVDVKFLHEVIKKKKKHFFSDMMRTWFVCYAWIKAQKVWWWLSREENVYIYCIFCHYIIIIIRSDWVLGCCIVHFPFLSFKPTKMSHKAANNERAAKRLVMEIREQKNLNGATDLPSILQEMTLTFLIVCGLWGLHSCSLWIYFLSELPLQCLYIISSKQTKTAQEKTSQIP